MNHKNIIFSTALILPLCLSFVYAEGMLPYDNQIEFNSIDAFSKSNVLYEVTTNNLNVRTAPGTHGKSIGKINKGHKLDILDIKNNWAKVIYKNKTGYVHSKYIKKINTKPPTNKLTLYKSTEDDLNIRDKASANGKILGKLNKNDTIEVYSFSGSWATVNYKGKKAYVHKNYLSLYNSNPETSEPDLKPPSSTSSNYVVTTNSLNIRDKASSKGKTLGKLKDGSSIKVISISNGWAKFSYQNIFGYVSSDYICKLIDKSTVDKNLLVLVNKKNSLGSTFVPNDLVTVNVKTSNGISSSTKKMKKDAAKALEKMFSAAKKDKITLLLRSGYRSYATQKQLYSRNVASMGSTQANKVSAKAGLSEHQTGLSVDILSSDYGKLNEGFSKTKAYKWMSSNAHKYGFIIRYPKNKTDVTGYSFEPWHIRYVGIESATDIYSKNLTLEEYLESNS